MAQGNNSGSGTFYRPTSLDYINRPNPVEPQSVPQKHPLNGTPQVSKPSNQDFIRLLLDRNANTENERPQKRKKSANGKSLDLPKLPVRQGTQKLRIPPTLSGLHQPPPESGILPSIFVEQVSPSAERDAARESNGDETAPASRTRLRARGQVDSPKTLTGKPKRHKWSDEETADLLRGVARFGIGSWTKILKCPDYNFQRRTALDLKDRFRVCRPDDYHHTKRPGQSDHVSAAVEESADNDDGKRKTVRSDRKSENELRELGISQPFVKTKRRKRHGYSTTEDDALLRGFQKYGNAWATICADEELGLKHRKPTDLRDRMRTKFPERYAKAGLAPRPDNFPKPARRHDVNQNNSNSTSENDHQRTNVIEVDSAAASATSSLSGPTYVQKPTGSKKQSQRPFLPYEDPYFGAPFENDDADSEPVKLDRHILDWASDFNKQAGSDAGKSHGIDPLATLKLPKPAASSSTCPSQPVSGSNATLPSLAAITSGSDGSADQLELPSLMAGPFEGDGRGGGHFLGFDELLS